jgi:hypothetical protein
MKILKILGPFGRLGNIIFQILNVLFIAIHYNYDIELFNNEWFITNYIKINTNDIDNNEDNIYITNSPYNFFYRNLIKDIDQNIFDINIPYVKERIRNIFKINYNDLKPLHEDNLVIHIRSGDIFINNIHPLYINPPFSYYKNIIEKKSYNKIYIVSEDKNNPVINKLIETYKEKIIFNLNSLEDDIKLIMSASDIIMSIGTFIPSILLFTDYTKNFFVPSHMLDNPVFKALINLINNK